MPKSRYRAAQIGGSADEVETAFYEALHNADLEQLMACWADEDEIVARLVAEAKAPDLA